MKIVMALLISLFAFSAAFAGAGGSTVGDGGHGVGCTYSNLNSLEMLDLFELQNGYGVLPNFPAEITFHSPNSIKEQIEIYWRIVSELKSRATAALGAGHPFLKVLEMYPSVALHIHHRFLDLQTYTNDQGSLAAPIPEECRLFQVGRRTVKDDGTSKVEVDLWMWSLLNGYNRIAFNLHESLHNWFSNGERHDTIAVRQAVGYLLAPSEYRSAKENQFKLLVNSRQKLDFKEFKK